MKPVLVDSRFPPFIIFMKWFKELEFKINNLLKKLIFFSHPTKSL